MSANVIWPDGRQCAVTVTVNFDGESVEALTMPPGRLWGRYAYGRYGAQIGIFRLLEVLQRHAIRATVFIPAWDAERYPEAMAAIAKAGHEVAGHGYLHEDFSGLASDQQHDVLLRSETTFQTVFGRKPAGWRAPNGLMAADTRAILVSRGYRYDSSFCDDDLPYIVQGHDRARLAELPVFETAGDRYYYALRRMPEHAQRAWLEEFDAVYCMGGLFNLTLHPRGDWGSGRSVRLQSVDALLQVIRERPRVWLATCEEVADRALATATEARDA